MKKIIFGIIVLLLSIFMFACKKENNKDDNGDVQKTITEIRVDVSHVNEDVTKFKVSDILVEVIYSDKSLQTINASNDMFIEEELSDIKRKGLYILNLSYEGFSSEVELMFTKESEKVSVKFYVEGSLYQTVEVKTGGSLDNIPDVPKKEGYKNEWDRDNFFKLYQDIEVNAVYTFIEPFTQSEEEEFFKELSKVLDEKYLDANITSDIELISEYDYHTITWTSNNENIISNSGKYNKTYVDYTVTLTASMKGNYSTLTKEYSYFFKGYKSLKDGINSGYIYRSYDKLNDNFFDTLDIVFAAFIPMDVNGGFDGINSNGNSIVTEFNRVTGTIAKHIMPKARENGIYVVPSLGGGGSEPAQTFLEIAKDENKRKTFAKNIVDLINKYDYDGIDIDWETPKSSDKQLFTLLMEEIYTAVKANNPNHIVTAAIAGGVWQPPCYDLTNSIKYLDYVNMMTYGMDNGAGRYQNALYASSSYNDTKNKVGSTLTSCSIDESVKIYNSYKIPNEKIIVGLAFYGMVQSKETGSWVAKGSSVTYGTIKERLASGEYTRYYDDRCKVPYLLSNDGLTFITYDDPQSIKDKITYCKAKGIAGVMYWENGCDLTGDLLQAIKEGYNN